jgi:hypothetical protein
MSYTHYILLHYVLQQQQFEFEFTVSYSKAWQWIKDMNLNLLGNLESWVLPPLITSQGVAIK